MPLKLYTILTFFTLTTFTLWGQPNKPVSITSTKEKPEVLPGQIINLAFFIENVSGNPQPVSTEVLLPDGWRLISSSQNFELKNNEKKFLIFTVQIPSNFPVGNFKVTLMASHSETKETLDSYIITIAVGEVEKINMILVESPDYVNAGEEFRGEFLIQNQGNTTKKVYIETRNCTVEGSPDVEINPGESARVFVVNKTSPDLTDTRTEYFTVRALVSGEVAESIFRSVLVFPSKEKKKDLYFRFPVEFSTTYLASNQRGSYEQAWQFELSGNGTLDEEGKHRLEFLARGPNNTNLSFLGMYDQYFISYANKNLELFAGEKAFLFTPLTESSRFGLGAESKVVFNNGLNFGFLYVKPRFYKEIQNEMAAFTGFEFNDKNSIEIYLISKQLAGNLEQSQLVSLNSRFHPFERTSVELEISRGHFQEIWDNAMRANINSQFSIFNLAGNYYYTGKNYPGYFSNSTFYSGNFSMNLTPKISIGIYAKEDFVNAQLDTFFVNAPYSKSFQSMLNYNFASRAYLKFFWRQYERKDRLALDKFHYKTNSINSQLNHRFKRFEYSILGEYGETTNFLLETGKNQQSMYRGSLNLAYRFNANHSLRFFGSWSNINRFISGEQRNLMAGMSAVSQIAKNLHANFHIQNAFNIEDYYRNRNLMQLNLDFTPGRKHKISLRSFYTLFRQETENPEFTFSLNYAWNFGIPLKKVIKAGDLKGRVSRKNGEPAEGIMLAFFNKSTITNKNGEFSFKSVPAGRHLFFIDKSSLAIDEKPEISDHFEVEILEDKVSVVNFKIKKGARLTGKFDVQEEAMAILQRGEVKTKNIIIELKNEQEDFRITTDENGDFSFPLVRPGEWTFRIYTSSLPEGYEVEEPVIRILLQPSQNQDISVKLKQKKRNILFKSENNVLQPLNTLNIENKNIKTEHKEKLNEIESVSNTFYSVQVGAFKRKIPNDSNYFKDAPYDFEKQMDNLYKYFIGKFLSLNDAMNEQKKLEKIYKNPFVVKFENERLIQFENE